MLAMTLALGVSGARAASVPAVSNFSGTLTGSAPVSGWAEITFSVSDPSGVTSTALSLDNKVVETYPPIDGATTLGLDTATLRDGSYQVSATVTDGLGATTTVWVGAIMTFNAPLGGEPLVEGDDQ